MDNKKKYTIKLWNRYCNLDSLITYTCYKDIVTVVVSANSEEEALKRAKEEYPGRRHYKFLQVELI